MAGARGSIVRGALWMFVISVLLFWLPVSQIGRSQSDRSPTATHTSTSSARLEAQ
jgi:hypothetical protein